MKASVDIMVLPSWDAGDRHVSTYEQSRIYLHVLHVFPEQPVQPEDPEAGVNAPPLLKLTADMSFSRLQLWHFLQKTSALLPSTSSSNISPHSRQRNSKIGISYSQKVNRVLSEQNRQVHGRHLVTEEHLLYSYSASCERTTY